MNSDFYKLFIREIYLSINNFRLIFSFLIFFILSILIFTFAFGKDIAEIGNLYKSVIWVVLIFSIMLISENFLINDYNDGSLKELQFLGYSEELIILCKSIVMWFAIILPVTLLIPIFSIFFNLHFSQSIQLLINLFLATPSLTLISIVSSLFSIQLRKNKIVRFVVIFPFYIPIIIFSTMPDNQNVESYLQSKNFFILIGIFFITLPLSLIVSKLIMKEINK